jgi:hypothetical protein
VKKRLSSFLIPITGIILFLVTVAVIIILSLLTKPIPREELDGLTWVTLKNKTAMDTKPNEGAMNEVAFSLDKGENILTFTHSLKI